jgi:hypothetical protein
MLGGRVPRGSIRPGIRLAKSGGRPGKNAEPAPKGALLGPLLKGKLPMPPGAAARSNGALSTTYCSQAWHPKQRV